MATVPDQGPTKRRKIQSGEQIGDSPEKDQSLAKHLLEEYSLGSEWVPRLQKLKVNNIKALEYLTLTHFEALKKHIVDNGIEEEALKKLCKVDQQMALNKDTLSQEIERLETKKADMSKNLSDLQAKSQTELQALAQRLNVEDPTWVKNADQDALRNKLQKFLSNQIDTITQVQAKGNLTQQQIFEEACSGELLKAYYQLSEEVTPVLCANKMLKFNDSMRLLKNNSNSRDFTVEIHQEQSVSNFIKSFKEDARSASAQASGGFFGVSVSVSGNYSEAQSSENTSQRNVNTNYMSTVKVSTLPFAQTDMQNQEIELSNGAADFLNKIQEKFDLLNEQERKALFSQFFQEYGSHVNRSSILGAYYLLKAETTGLQVEQKSTASSFQRKAIQVSIAASGWGYSAEAGLSSESAYGSFEGNSYNEFSQKTSVSIEKAGGPQEVNNLYQWKELAAANNYYWQIIERDPDKQASIWDIVTYKLNQSKFDNFILLAKRLLEYYNKCTGLQVTETALFKVYELEQADLEESLKLQKLANQILNASSETQVLPISEINHIMNSLTLSAERFKQIDHSKWVQFVQKPEISDFFCTIIEKCKLIDVEDDRQRCLSILLNIIEQSDSYNYQLRQYINEIFEELHSDNALKFSFEENDHRSIETITLKLRLLKDIVSQKKDAQSLKRQVFQLNDFLHSVIDFFTEEQPREHLTFKLCFIKYFNYDLKEGTFYVKEDSKQDLMQVIDNVLKYKYELIDGLLDTNTDAMSDEEQIDTSVNAQQNSVQNLDIKIWQVRLFMKAQLIEKQMNIKCARIQKMTAKVLKDTIHPEVRIAYKNNLKLSSLSGFKNKHDYYKDLLQGQDIIDITEQDQQTNLLDAQHDQDIVKFKYEHQDENLQQPFQSIKDKIQNTKASARKLLMFKDNQEITEQDLKLITTCRFEKEAQNPQEISRKFFEQLIIKNPDFLQVTCQLDDQVMTDLETNQNIEEAKDDFLDVDLDMVDANVCDNNQQENESNNSSLRKHSIDLIFAIYSICNKTAQEMLALTLFQQKKEIPFIVHGQLQTYGLRNLEVKQKGALNDRIALKSIPSIAFISLSEVQYDVAKLINLCFFGQNHNIFINRETIHCDQPLEYADKGASIMWYQKKDYYESSFQMPISLIKVHGVTNYSRNKNILKFLSENCSTIVLLADMKNQDDFGYAKDILKDLQAVIQAANKIEKGQQLIFMYNAQMNSITGNKTAGVCKKFANASWFQYIQTTSQEVNQMCAQKLRAKIENALSSKQFQTKSLEQMVPDLKSFQPGGDDSLIYDMHQPEIARSQAIIDEFLKSIANKPKKSVLKLSGDLLQEYVQQFMKFQNPPKGVDQEKFKQNQQKLMQETRKKQSRTSIEPGFGMLINKIINTSNEMLPMLMNMLNICLNDFNIEQNYGLYKQLETKLQEADSIRSEMASKKDQELENLKQREKDLLTDCGSIKEKIDQKTIGLEHLYREIQEFYISRSQGQSNDFDNIVKQFANLWIRGGSLELMDGDNSYVPLEWFEAVMNQAEKILTKELGFSPKIGIVPILGIQSSGKSTFLNVLFSLQFKVAQIRCTKGIFMQILFIDRKAKDQLGIEFDIIIVCDTEGLRAEELKLQIQNFSGTRHDNRMGTFVIAISDLTLINCMGLQTDQIQEVLEIVTYALIQTDATEINPAFMFIHQNIDGDHVRSQNIATQQQIKSKFDEITEISARKVGKHNKYKQWSDVIKHGKNDPFIYISPIGNTSLSAGYTKDCINFKNNVILTNLNDLIIQQKSAYSDPNMPQPHTFARLKYKVRQNRGMIETVDYILNFQNELQMQVSEDVEDVFLFVRREFSLMMQKKELDLKNEISKMEIQNKQEQNILEIQKQLQKEHKINIEQDFKSLFETKIEEMNSSMNKQQHVDRYKAIQLQNLDYVMKTRFEEFNKAVKGFIKDSMATNNKFIAEQKQSIEKIMRKKMREQSKKFLNKDKEQIIKAFNDIWKKVYPQEAKSLKEEESGEAEALRQEIYEANTDEPKLYASYTQVKKAKDAKTLSLSEFGSKDYILQTSDDGNYYPDIANHQNLVKRGYNWMKGGDTNKSNAQKIHNQLLKFIEDQVQSIKLNSRYSTNVYTNIIQEIAAQKTQLEDKFFGPNKEGQTRPVEFTEFYTVKLKILAGELAQPQLQYLIAKQKDESPYEVLQRQLKPELQTMFIDICKQINATQMYYNSIIQILSTVIIESLLKERLIWISSCAEQIIPAQKQAIIARMMEDLLDMSSDDFIKFTQNYQQFLYTWVKSKMEDVYKMHALSKGKDELQLEVEKHLSKLQQLSIEDRPGQTLKEWLNNNYSDQSEICTKITNSIGEDILSSLQSNLVYIELVNAKDALKEHCNKKFDSDIEKGSEADKDKLFENSATEYIKTNMGCTQTCPFCSAVCQYNTIKHGGKCKTEFHTCEALRCDSVWKSGAYFVTCYQLIEKNYPFHTFKNGQRESWYYKEYTKAGPPYSEWQIDTSEGKDQLKFYDYMLSKYQEQICAYMKASACQASSLKSYTKEECIDELKKFNKNYQ